MAPATLNGTFSFDANDTIADLLIVAETLRKSGRTPLLRFVRSYNDQIESVAVDMGPELGAEESARLADYARAIYPAPIDPVADRDWLAELSAPVTEDSARPEEMAVAGNDDDLPDSAGVSQ